MLEVRQRPPRRVITSLDRWRMAPNKSKPTPAAAKTGPTTWIVEYHWQAVEDLKGFDDRKQKGVLTVADFLRQLGTKIKEPHMNPITGEKKIRELRPRRRTCAGPAALLPGGRAHIQDRRDRSRVPGGSVRVRRRPEACPGPREGRLRRPNLRSTASEPITRVLSCQGT